jgi:hypothetical protein
MLSGVTEIVILREALAICAVGVSESVTVQLKEDAPTNGPVGVPEITPALLKLKPAGKVPGGTFHV